MDQTARQGAYIGSAMTADFRFIPDATQGNAGKLSIHSTGNALGKARLPDSGRTHKTDNRATVALGKGTDSKIIQDPFLDLLQAVVILIKDLGSFFNVVIILGHLAPGQTQTSIKITADDSTFSHHGGHLEKPIKFLVKGFFDLFREIQFCHLCLVLIHFGLLFVPFVEFLADSFHLFSQIIFTLILFDLLTDLLGNVLFKGNDFQFLTQIGIQKVQPLLDTDGFEEFFLSGTSMVK